VWTYIPSVEWEVEYTDEFGSWWETLTDAEQAALAARVDLLTQRGPDLRRPVVGEIKGSKYDPQMKELVTETGQASLRVLFMFDPRRVAILLLGGDKTGSWNRWYRDAIPQADTLYEVHLEDSARRERHKWLVTRTSNSAAAATPKLPRSLAANSTRCSRPTGGRSPRSATFAA